MLSSLAKHVEVLLFVAVTPVSEKELSMHLDESLEAVCSALGELSDHYAQDHGITLRKVAEGWELCTDPEFAETVAIFRETALRQKVRLSRAAVESLAVIAYNQPVTRAEIEEIRGVRCERVLETLLSHGLIRIAGRRRGTGSPLLYRTTETFLEHFGLESIAELPTLEEVGEYSVEESEH